LQVTGLAEGTYVLSIDGEPAGKVSNEDLAKGWNLANSAGPITKQAHEVLALIFQKNNHFFQRWRTVQLFECPAWLQSPEAESRRVAQLARLDKQIAETEAQTDALRKPKSHHFELRKLQGRATRGGLPTSVSPFGERGNSETERG
jgi:hypothetical protein